MGGGLGDSVDDYGFSCGDAVTQLLQGLVIGIIYEGLDGSAIGETKEDYSYRIPISFDHFVLASADQIFATVAIDKRHDGCFVSLVLSRIVNVNVYDEIGWHGDSLRGIGNRRSKIKDLGKKDLDFMVVS